MIDKCLYEKVSREAAFLFLFLLGCVTALASFEKPDFAYPKTVEADASSVLEKSISSKDWERAMHAAVQLSIAETLISQDNYSEGVKNFERIAKMSPAPWRNVAYLLEGKLYAQLYQSKKWVFDKREVSADTDLNDPMEWDRTIFLAKVKDLLTKANQDSDNNSTPIADIKSLLLDTDDAIAYRISVGDFIGMQSVEISCIFGSEESDVYLSSLKKSVSTETDKGRESYLSWFIYQNSGSDRAEYLNEVLNRIGNTKYATPFILQKSYDDDTAFYKELTDYQRRFPDCINGNAIKNKIATLLEKTINFSCNGQYLSDTGFKLKLKTNNLESFNVLLLRLPESYISKDIMLDKVQKEAKVVKCYPCTIKGQPAHTNETELDIEGLTQGVYAFVASETKELSGLITGRSPKLPIPTFLVSDITLFTVNDAQKNKYGRIYVVDGHTQKPISGANVKLTPTNRTQKNSIKAVTDKEGKVEIPKSGWDVTVVYGKNRLKQRVWGYERTVHNNVSKNVKILTDLALYHPGDTLKFVAISYSEKNRRLNVDRGEKIKILLRDPDWKSIDSLELTSDERGRSIGKFILPASDKLGSYTLASIIDKLHRGSVSVEVAEYKAPKFFISANVEMESSQSPDSLPDSIVKIAGEVRAYSGVAEGNALVRYTVEVMPWRWGSISGNNKISGECSSNAEGKFSIELNSRDLPSLNFSKGISVASPYIVRLSASNQGGESAEATPLRFCIGEGRSINANLPAILNVSDKKSEFKVTIVDPLGNQIDGEIYYQILNDKKEVVNTGEFKSPLFNLDGKKLPSGKYEVKFSLNDNFSAENQDVDISEIILYRNDDIIPPVSTALWTPERKIELKEGEKNAEIRYGSSFSGSWIYVQIANCDSIIESKWIENNGRINTIKVKAPKDNSRLFVTLTGMHNLKQESTTITVIPAEQVTPMIVHTLSFRDKISPNGKESWKFKFERGGKPMSNLSVSCVMTDKALNAIYPFVWNFNPTDQLYYPNLNQLSLYNSGYCGWYLPVTKAERLRTSSFTYPEVNFYGYSLFSGIRVRGRGSVMTNGSEQIMYSSAKMSLAAAKEEAEADAVFASVDMAGAVDVAIEGDAGIQNQDVVTRMAEHPVAFFKPELHTNNNGELSLEFTAPDFLGSWQFQMIGYSEDMKSVYWTKDIESSKALMVRINYPRFLRIGDKAVLTATIYNNSDEKVLSSGRIEIFDPVNNNALKCETIASIDIDKYGSRVVSISYEPKSVGSIGIRVIAESEKSSDGEQMLIPIFSSSESVVEGETFYFSPEQSVVEILVPERFRTQEGLDKSLTLNFCADPLWECVKALPEIKSSETFNSLKVADNIFSLSLEGKLIKNNPQFSEVLKSYSPEKSDAELQEAIKQLKSLQLNDGGWSWCKDMRSSEFVTLRILSLMSKLQKMEALPTEMEPMCSSALAYLDRKTIENVNKYQKRNYPYLSLLDYLWVRDSFKKNKADAQVQSIISKIVSAVKKDWKSLGIAQKSKAAVVLNAHGYQMLGREILESLRQYATITEKGGMWFDNIRDLGNTPLSVNCLVLDAYSELAPQSKCVDQLRQWILLDKQTRKWGDGVSAVNAIYSILNTGTKWIGKSTPEVRVKINNEYVDIPSMEKYTGAFTIKLPENVKSVVVERSGSSPAWGGLIFNYVAPIKDIKAYSSNDLKVEKQIVASPDLKVGDKVRINLIVKNNRAMDLVEVRDGLGAYLLPTEQVSGYYGSDGLWMYKEIGKNAVNLFIETLPKGTHVFSYDCTVTHAGTYSEGIVSAECILYPSIVVHSAGEVRDVK